MGGGIRRQAVIDMGHVGDGVELQLKQLWNGVGWLLRHLWVGVVLSTGAVPSREREYWGVGVSGYVRGQRQVRGTCGG